MHSISVSDDLFRGRRFFGFDTVLKAKNIAIYVSLATGAEILDLVLVCVTSHLHWFCKAYRRRFFCYILHDRRIEGGVRLGLEARTNNHSDPLFCFVCSLIASA